MITETTLKTETSLQKESIFNITNADINTVKVEDYLYGKIIHSKQIITSDFVAQNGGIREHIQSGYILTIETSKELLTLNPVLMLNIIKIIFSF